MGDFNTNVKFKGNGYRKLEEFCDMFYLTNLVDIDLCYTNSHKSTIDLTLYSKLSSFQNPMATKTGLSDFHELVSTFLKGERKKFLINREFYFFYYNTIFKVQVLFK